VVRIHSPRPTKFQESSEDSNHLWFEKGATVSRGFESTHPDQLNQRVSDLLILLYTLYYTTELRNLYKKRPDLKARPVSFQFSASATAPNYRPG
jgi:hypothetical protein